MIYPICMADGVYVVCVMCIIIKLQCLLLTLSVLLYSTSTQEDADQAASGPDNSDGS